MLMLFSFIFCFISTFGECTTVSSNLIEADFETFTAENRCDHLLAFLSQSINQNYIGEEVSQLEHALQAAYFAAISGADEETILAALFHDIGHLCAIEEKKGAFGVSDHDIVGAEYLKQCGFSDKICQLVLGHVQAKRYLTFICPEYYLSLSEASKVTLGMQGGPMNQEEAILFENDPLFSLKIEMRNWDEKSKVVGLIVPDLNSYRPLIIKYLTPTTSI